MPTCTPFKDLGKTCSDLLSKDFTVGKHICEVKTKTANGVTFTPKATNAGGKFDASLAAKYMFPGKVSGEGKIDTAGVLSTTVETARFAKGLTLTLDTSTPTSGTALFSSAKATADYKQEAFAAKATYEYYKQAASAAVSAVYGSFTMGCSADYSVAKSSLAKCAAACQFVQPDFTLCATLSDSPGKPGSTVYAGSYFHKISSAMQVGGELTKTSSDTGFAFGCLYKLDKSTSVKGKVNTDGILSASYKQAISPMTTLTLAAAVDTVDLAASSKHKVGMELKIAP